MLRNILAFINAYTYAICIFSCYLFLFNYVLNNFSDGWMASAIFWFEQKSSPIRAPPNTLLLTSISSNSLTKSLSNYKLNCRAFFVVLDLILQMNLKVRVTEPMS